MPGEPESKNLEPREKKGPGDNEPESGKKPGGKKAGASPKKQPRKGKKGDGEQLTDLEKQQRKAVEEQLVKARALKKDCDVTQAQCSETINNIDSRESWAWARHERSLLKDLRDKLDESKSRSDFWKCWSDQTSIYFANFARKKYSAATCLTEFEGGMTPIRTCVTKLQTEIDRVVRMQRANYSTE